MNSVIAALAFVTCAIAMLPSAYAEDSQRKIIDVVFVLPNDFRGPIFVDAKRLALPEFNQRQKNTYTTVIVDEDGDAVQLGRFDKVSGWSYRYTIVQRNGKTIPVAGVGTEDDDEIAFHAIGGYGAWQRMYRPESFAAYFVGTAKQAEQFREDLRRRVEASSAEMAGE